MPEDTKREARIARLRALMAKTVANGCTEAEAQSASEAVDRLLAEYEIDLDEVAVGKQEVIQLDIACLNHPVTHAASRIAGFCDCRVWTRATSNELCFLGLEIDVEIAEYLVMLFKRSLDREGASYTLGNAEYAAQSKSGRKDMLASFHTGMAIRLGDRLSELKSKRDFARKDAGTALVILKKPMIDEAFASLGLTMGRSRGGPAYGSHSGARAAGASAANSVNISQGVRGASNRKIGR
jgi:hypothetical protein